MPEIPTITLIIPVKDEQESVIPFLSITRERLAGLDAKLEFLFIDDGSTDETLALIKQVASSDSGIQWVSLSRNFGKEAAMTAGLEYACGDAVVLIDVDLQDPPEVILDFVRLWRQGYDSVYGTRSSRNEDTQGKRTSAGWFYMIFNRLSSLHIPPNTGDFRLLDRRVVEALKRMPERSRFMKAMYSWPGFRSTGVSYARPARLAGTTKFNYWKLWNFALDGFVSFSTWPIRVWSYIGGLTALISFFYMVVVVGKVLLFGRDVPGYASLMTAILFFGGMQLLSIGILGEYVSRLFVETKQRPLYLVSESNVDKLNASDRKHHAPAESSRRPETHVERETVSR